VRQNLTEHCKRFNAMQAFVVPWRYDAKMSPGNSLHASAKYIGYNDWINNVIIIIFKTFLYVECLVVRQLKLMYWSLSYFS